MHKITRISIMIGALFSFTGLATLTMYGNAQAGTIISNMNNKCLDVPNSNFRAGVPLEMWDCHGAVNQNFTQDASGQIKIAGLCVDAWGGQGNNGDRVGLYTCNGGANQRWILANGRLIGMKGRCMDISGRNSSNGAPILLWDCNGGNNQLWHGMNNNVSTVNQINNVHPGILNMMNISPNSLKEAAALTTVAPLTAVAPLTSVSPLR